MWGIHVGVGVKIMTEELGTNCWLSEGGGVGGPAK